MLRLLAITPKRKTINLDLQRLAVSRSMTNFGTDMQNTMAKYPPAKPWTARTPRRGLRKGGRRTGAVGRGWQVRYKRVDGAVVEAEVSNAVSYVVHVQGPKRGAKGARQTRVMRERGWQNITDESRKVWKRNRAGVVGSLSTLLVKQ